MPMQVSPGLCGRCRHARTVTSDRGRVFWMCTAHRRIPGLRKYPTLPVLECAGFERGEGPK